MWRIELPNLPTIIINLLIFLVSVLMIIHAINTQNVAWGIGGLIFNMIEPKLDYRH